MIPRCSLKPTKSSKRNAESITKRKSGSGRNGSQSDGENSQRPAIRFRKGQPRLQSSAHSRLVSFVVSHRGKTLTLFEWSRRTKAGLTPSNIWSRLRAGFPLEEALGGPEAVKRALAFVSEREKRSARRQAKLAIREKRKVIAKRKRGRPHKSRPNKSILSRQFRHALVNYRQSLQISS